MARRTRCSDAGFVDHVLNRAVGRATLLDKPADYAAFEMVVRQAWERTAMRLLSYVVHAQPLAPCRLARAGRSPEHRGAVADRDARAPLARPSSERRHRT